MAIEQRLPPETDQNVKLYEKIQMTDGQLFKLVTHQPHDFGDVDHYRSMPAQPHLGRDQQTERTCKRCGLVKITVHPKEGGGYRLWRWGDAPAQFADRVTPECGGVVVECAKETA
jgi:hypothetical protein